eukprot:7772975-Pyramimonas_sp.AAC.1
MVRVWCEYHGGGEWWAMGDDGDDVDRSGAIFLLFVQAAKGGHELETTAGEAQAGEAPGGAGQVPSGGQYHVRASAGRFKAEP